MQLLCLINLVAQPFDQRHLFALDFLPLLYHFDTVHAVTILIDRTLKALLHRIFQWLALGPIYRRHSDRLVSPFSTFHSSSVKFASYPFVSMDLYLLMCTMPPTLYFGNGLSTKRWPHRVVNTWLSFLLLRMLLCLVLL